MVNDEVETGWGARKKNGNSGIFQGSLIVVWN